MPAAGTRHGVSPVLGVFGANASGKSNLLAALSELKEMVAGSFVGLRPDQPLPFVPFALREGADEQPTVLDIDLILEGVRYHFGVRYSARLVHEEWLFSWPEGRRQVLFHRVGAKRSDWWFSPSLRVGRGRLAEIANATRDNSLLLSTAVQFNLPALQAVAHGIVSRCRQERPVQLQGHPLFSPDEPVVQAAHRETVLRFLEAADLGVVDLKTVPFHQDKSILDVLRTHLTPEALAKVEETFANHSQLLELWLIHQGADRTWPLSPLVESRGTQVLLTRLNDLLTVLEQGSLLILDELDTSLHPDLCRALIGLFTDSQTNAKGAQLLFSTHDRGLLTALRRDQVVLVDKDAEGASRLRSAADFRGLRSRDDVRRAHEQGRLGGVPVLGDLKGALRESGRGA